MDHKPDGPPDEQHQVDQEGDGEHHLVLPGEDGVKEADEQVDGACEDGEHSDEWDDGVVDPREEEANTGEGEKNELQLGVVRDTQQSAHNLQSQGRYNFPKNIVNLEYFDHLVHLKYESPPGTAEELAQEVHDGEGEVEDPQRNADARKHVVLCFSSLHFVFRSV